MPTEGTTPNPLNALKDLKGLATGGVLGTVGAGLAAMDLGGDLVEAIGGGKGKGDLVRAGGLLTLPGVLADIGAQRVLDAVGIDDPDTKKTAGQLAAAGAV
ncbi:MAG TPA: hypothetical protein VNA24_03870, partial [Hyalangium sp.]|nr:hypothetical protein [Hyalangium sp.]